MIQTHFVLPNRKIFSRKAIQN